MFERAPWFSQQFATRVCLSIHLPTVRNTLSLFRLRPVTFDGPALKRILPRNHTMARDIDYAAAAVNRAIVEKFGRSNELQNLTLTAGESTITVRDGEHCAEGTRDDLLAALRGSETYADFWQAFQPGAQKR
jgi:hypothetical protein